MAGKRAGASKPSKSARRARVVEATLAGKPQKAIAAAEKVSRGTVARDLTSAETRLLIDVLMDARYQRINTMLDLALDVCENAMRAQKKLVVGIPGGGQNVVDGGDDYYAQLTAVGRYKDLCLANRPRPSSGGDDAGEGGLVTGELVQKLKELLGGQRGR